jgi:hypothetical protein
MSERKPVQGVVIKPDGSHTDKVFKQLTDYQDAVNGYIEAVRLYDYNGLEVACAYVDEEGLLKQLPLNPMGGALSFLFGNNPYLCGNMIIVGKCDDDGYDTDIPEYISTLIKNISAKQEEVVS